MQIWTNSCSARPDALTTTWLLTTTRELPPAPRSKTQSDPEAKNRTLRVLLVDDHRIIRDGLSTLLGRQQQLQVVGEASNGREGVEKVSELLPDVVLMDIVMPEMDGIEATRIIRARWPSVQVVALSMFETDEARRQMLAAGACAYLNKSVDFSHLLSTVYGCGKIDPVV